MSLPFLNFFLFMSLLQFLPFTFGSIGSVIPGLTTSQFTPANGVASKSSFTTQSFMQTLHAHKPYNTRQVKIIDSPGRIDSLTPTVNIVVDYRAVCDDSIVAEIVPGNIKLGPRSPSNDDYSVQVLGRTVVDVTRGHGRTSIAINLAQFLNAGGDYRIRVFIYGTNSVHKDINGSRHKACANNCHYLKVDPGQVAIGQLPTNPIVPTPFINNPVTIPAPGTTVPIGGGTVITTPVNGGPTIITTPPGTLPFAPGVVTVPSQGTNLGAITPVIATPPTTTTAVTITRSSAWAIKETVTSLFMFVSTILILTISSN